MTAPDIDLDALEAAALAATPGPWILGCLATWDCEGVPIRYVYRTKNETHHTRTRVISGLDEAGVQMDCDSDAAHIAAANPAVVLELIRRLRAAEGETK